MSRSQTRRKTTKIFVFSVFLVLIPAFVLAASSSIDATVKITVCGDSVVDTGEQCDGSNLNGTSCTSRGFAGGTLLCSVACEFDVSECTAGSSSSSSGGGGGGIISQSNTSAASVTFKGRAYPGSTVTLLKDAQIAATVDADAGANFDISLSNLSSGSYMFSVYGEDARGNRSSLKTLPITVIPGATVNVTSIFIAPTVAVDKNEVKRGDNIAIFGQSAPYYEVTISINSEEEIFLNRVADKDGTYLVNFNTSVLEMGEHITKAKAASLNEITAFGRAVGFTVGTRKVDAKSPDVAIVREDTNGDGRVNIIDFSMVAYWYKRPNPPSAFDINDDGKIDLIDFSIMASNWTG